MNNPVNIQFMPSLAVHGSGYTLPLANLLAWFKSSVLDKVGDHDGDVFPLQSGLIATGDYLTGTVAAGTTVTSSEGTSVITITEGQLACTTGTLWSVVLSNGSRYEAPIYISPTMAVWPDVSGNERHLLLANDTAVDADAHCVESLEYGSNWVNDNGYTLSTGSQVIPWTSYVYPVGVPIPALADGSGCVGALYVAPEGISLTIPATNLDADLSNFPVMVQLSDMPTTFWDNASADGGTIRVANSGDTDIPIDLVRFEADNKYGVLFFKGDLSSSSDNQFLIYNDSGASKLPANDVLGAHAVWADYASVKLFFTDTLDRTSLDIGVGDGNISGQSFLESQSTSGDIGYGQGICCDGTYFYAVDNNGLGKFDADWVLIDSDSNPIGSSGIPGVDHCGDPVYYNGKIYFGMVESDVTDNQHIAVFDAATLDFITSTDISAYAPSVATIGYNPDTGLLYVMSYYQSDTFWTFDPDNDLTYDGEVSVGVGVSGALTLVQGITYYNGRFLITSDATNCPLWIVNADGTDGEIIEITDAYHIQGITTKGSNILVLDASLSGDIVTTYTFNDNALCATGGVEFLNPYSKGLAFEGVPELTTFTLGASFAISDTGINRQVMSYHDASQGGTSVRVSMGWSNSQGSLGTWCWVDSWLVPSPTIVPTINQPYRLHTIYDGTSSRRLYINGAESASQTGGISGAPSGLDTLWIGAEDPDRNEAFQGVIGFTYLRSGILPDAWIKAEYDNLNSPNTFYMVTT